MSLFHPTNLVCPACKTLVTMDAVGSVNADRRPDYRDDILADRFQDTTCTNCGASFRLQPNFNYLDAGQGQWIAGLPAGRQRDWVATEDEVTALFATSYGARAPKAAQSVGEGLSPRLTFGWPAIREKIFARQHELDDVVLEMLKLDLLRRLPDAPLAEGVELRLFLVDGDRMRLIWISSETEKPLEEIEVGREIYDNIAANADAWAGVRKTLTDGPFVDMQKMFIGDGRGAVAAQ